MFHGMGVGVLRHLRYPEPRGVSVPYQVLIRIDGFHICPWAVDRRDKKKQRPKESDCQLSCRACPFPFLCCANLMAFAPFRRSAARHLTGKACIRNADHFSDTGRVYFFLPASQCGPLPPIKTAHSLKTSVLRNTPRPLDTILRLAHLPSLRYERLHLSLQHGLQ